MRRIFLAIKPSSPESETRKRHSKFCNTRFNAINATVWFSIYRGANLLVYILAINIRNKFRYMIAYTDRLQYKKKNSIIVRSLLDTFRNLNHFKAPQYNIVHFVYPYTAETFVSQVIFS